VAHGYYDRVDGDIHHDYVEDLKADTEGRDVDDVEAAGAHGERLEESVEDAVVGGDGFCGWVANVEEFEGGPVDAV